MTGLRTGGVAVEHVSYVRGGRAILDDVSFRAEPGAVTGLVGPSGSGKSSLLAIIAGLERPEKGSITHAFASAEVGLVLQAYGLVGLLTAAENVEMPLQAAGGSSRTEVRSRAADALADVDLGPVVDHLIEQLSGGQQQRVAIARALVVRPRLLLADEFTAELDAANRGRAADSVFALAATGATVVIATHDPALAERCDRIIRLESGRVV